MTAFNFETTKSGVRADLGAGLTIDAEDPSRQPEGFKCSLGVRQDGKIRDADRVNLTSERSRSHYIKRLAEMGLEVPGGLLLALVEALRESPAMAEPEREGPVKDVEPWPEPVDGALLLDEMYGTIRRFIWLSEHKARSMSLWIAHTHAIDAASVTPILALTSPQKRCGKTTAMALVGRVAARPLVASNISAPAVFRTIEAWLPTLLIDEADSFLKDNEELRGVLNSGHGRETAYVIRMESVGDNFEPRQFTTWAAKSIALIGRLPDTLADRSIPIELERRLPSEKIEKLRHADPELFTRLARQCRRWADDNIEALKAARPAIPERLHDRAADNWEALLAIASLAGGDWPTLARNAALALSGEEAGVEADSLATRLLRDLRPIVEAHGGDDIPTTTLIEKLIAIDEAPWGEINRGKPINPERLARMLKPFGVKSKRGRVGAENLRVYGIAKLVSVFARYMGSNLEHPEQRDGEMVSADDEPGTGDPPFQDGKTPETARQANVPGVPSAKGGAGDTTTRTREAVA